MIEPGSCKKCVDEHPRCHGHRRRPAGRSDLPLRPCMKHPLVGYVVCLNHGGGTPKLIAVTQKRIAREEAIKLMLTLGEPCEDEDPGVIIMEQIRWRRAHVAWLRSKVQELTERDLVWGVTKEATGGQNIGTTSEAKPNAFEELYREYSGALEALCLAAIKMGLEERRVRLDEKDQEGVIRLLDNVILALGHNPGDPAVATIILQQLKQLSD